MGFHSVLKIYKAKELNAFFWKAESPNKYYYLYSNSILPKNMLGGSTQALSRIIHLLLSNK